MKKNFRRKRLLRRGSKIRNFTASQFFFNQNYQEITAPEFFFNQNYQEIPTPEFFSIKIFKKFRQQIFFQSKLARNSDARIFSIKLARNYGAGIFTIKITILFANKKFYCGGIIFQLKLPKKNYCAEDRKLEFLLRRNSFSFKITKKLLRECLKIRNFTASEFFFNQNQEEIPTPEFFQSRNFYAGVLK